MDIEGIIVLSQNVKEVVVENGFSITPLALLLFGIAIISFFGWLHLALTLIEQNIDNVTKALVIGLIIAVVCGICISGGIIDSTKTTSYKLNTYSVTIADDVSFKEVVDNYNLISRDGEIFVLQEKIPKTE